MKILVVEDNRELTRNIVDYLSKEGDLCETALTYDEAVDKVVSFSYDIVVLDIMLPDGNGLDVINMLKKLALTPGILIVSAKNSLEDKLAGLDLGADDYLTKPFHLSELNARLKAIYRRKSHNNNTLLQINELTIDTDALEVGINGQLLELTRKEYEMLLFLISNQNRVITKQSIAEHLWGDNADLYDKFDFVYQHIKNLRKKILHAGGNDYIHTVYGLGYKFNAHQ